MSTVQITSIPRVVIASWIVIAVIGALIIGCAVLGSLYAEVAPTDLLIGP